MKPGSNLHDLSLQPPFSVVIGYEDYASGVRALELYQRLVAHWTDVMEFRFVVWKFEPLGLPELSRRATQDALEADLILISLSGSHALPVEAKGWVDRWRGRTMNRPALALLLDGEYKDTLEAREIEGHLREIAKGDGLAFFSSTGTRVDFGERFPARRATVDALSFPEREKLLDHWGINE